MSINGRSCSKRNGDNQLELDLFSNAGQNQCVESPDKFGGNGKTLDEIIKYIKNVERYYPLMTKIKVKIMDGTMELICDPDKERETILKILDDNIKLINGHIKTINTQIKYFNEKRSYKFYKTANGLLNYLIYKVYKEFETKVEINKSEILVDQEVKTPIFDDKYHMIGVLSFVDSKYRSDVEIKNRVNILCNKLKELKSKTRDLEKYRKKVIEKGQSEFDFGE